MRQSSLSDLLPADDESALYFSRYDPEELLGSFAPFSFLLEDTLWPTVEHYLQAMQYASSAEQERVRQLDSPELAHKEHKGRWLRRQRKDWKNVRPVYLTRAIYTQCLTHEQVAKRLLETGEQRLVANDQYDYYWGCGRDRRGTNMYGQVLMSVRAKLRESQS
jgi:hypothetical protein